MRIILDPGHGGSDPGVVAPSGQRESHAALATALTLKHVYTLRKHEVELTRTADVRPDYSDRTARRDADLFISIHYNSVGTYPLVYYASETPSNLARSEDLAKRVARLLGIERVWPSTQSRFGRLYIDDVTYGPALLWEVDAIDRYVDTKKWRMERCTAFAGALEVAWKEIFG